MVDFNRLAQARLLSATLEQSNIVCWQYGGVVTEHRRLGEASGDTCVVSARPAFPAAEATASKMRLVRNMRLVLFSSG